MCFAEFLPVEVDQAAPVVIFLGRHVVEDLGAFGVIGAQAFGEVGVDPAVLLLGADGQGEHFFFGKVIDRSHGPIPRECGPPVNRCEA